MEELGNTLLHNVDQCKRTASDSAVINVYRKNNDVRALDKSENCVIFLKCSEAKCCRCCSKLFVLFTRALL